MTTIQQFTASSCACITHDGDKVVPVSSSEEALAQLAGGTIDLVVTDIKLPGLSGVDLVASMQENFAGGGMEGYEHG